MRPTQCSLTPKKKREHLQGHQRQRQQFKPRVGACGGRQVMEQIVEHIVRDGNRENAILVFRSAPSGGWLLVVVVFHDPQ